MLTLLSTLAVAAPLDDAAADGRPIVVIVSREPRLYEAVVWLTSADGAPRERQHEVALVYARPEDLAAWVGDPTLATRLDDAPLAYALVRVSAARQVEVWADVHVPNVRDAEITSTWSSLSALPVSRDNGASPATFARQAGLPGGSPAPAQRAAPRRVEAEPRYPDDAHPPNQTSHEVDDTAVQMAERAVVDAFDAALWSALIGIPRRAPPPELLSTTPTVAGAVRCRVWCGVVCEPPPGGFSEPPAAAEAALFRSAMECGASLVGSMQAQFLLRWPQ